MSSMERALQLVFSQQVRDVTGESNVRRVPSLCPPCVEAPAPQPSSPDGVGRHGLLLSSAAAKVGSASVVHSRVPRSAEESGALFNSNKVGLAPSPPASSLRSAGLPAASDTFIDIVSPQNSPSVLTTATCRRPKLPSSGSNGCLSSASANMACGTDPAAGSLCSHVDPSVSAVRSTPLLKSLSDAAEMVLPSLVAYDGSNRCGRTNTLLGVSNSSEGLDSATDYDAGRKQLFLSDSGDSREEKTTFFKAKPRLGKFVPLIEWLLHCGEAGELTPPTTVTEDGTEKPSALLCEDAITKLCTAATAVLAKEPTLLELEVDTADTLVVVGDIHGQFQDLYTSVLCQQYDRRKCNPGGLDRHFLFMGDYVDRGPHSLEVVLLLLALKVEYPTLVYLTRGNHEEEKTSRVYGFLTEATSSLGAAAGTAVWSAVNKVFLDLPLAALVTTPRFRFLVMHGGLSPALQTIDQIASIDRHAYNTGELTKEAHDIVDGLLWSDPAIGIGCFAASARGCGWSFGPATSNNFCAENRIKFICRAHQLAMDGYFWTHNDRVVTVFSAPNYCGINDNRGAVMVVNGHANKPAFEQYEYYEEMDYGGCPSSDFPYSSYFC